MTVGSQRYDIFYALEAFAEHCDRHPLDRRPTYWAQYVDMWGDAKGEMGVSNPTSVDDPERSPHNTVFALLCPWLAIPTMAQAWVVVDDLDCLWVIGVRATNHGYFWPVWEVAYRMEDDGSLTPGEPRPIPMPTKIGPGVAAAVKARSQQQLWEGDYDIDALIPVVEGLLNE